MVFNKVFGRALVVSGFLGSFLFLISPSYAEIQCPCFTKSEIIQTCDGLRDVAVEGAKGCKLRPFYTHRMSGYSSSCRLDQPDINFDDSKNMSEGHSFSADDDELYCSTGLISRNVFVPGEPENYSTEKKITVEEAKACLRDLAGLVEARGRTDNVNDPEKFREWECE